jgi:predicted transcriptional regulator
MKLSEVIEAIDGQALCCKDLLDKEVKFGFSSDLMSDVLTLRDDDILLITGLANIQSIRTAELSDINAIVLVRNKAANQAMIDMATDSDIMIITTKYSMFKTSGLLFDKGLSPIY